MRPHNLPGQRHSTLAFLFLLVLPLFITACGTFPSNPPPSVKKTPTTQPPPSSSSVDSTTMAMLNNIKANGYNDNPAINNGLGGLWINWRYGTNPLQTNLNGSGSPDGSDVNPPRHDPLTDLRYLNGLWLYKNLHPSDTQFDGELQRYTAIVKSEFTQAENDRGWVYDTFINLYTLSNDSFYQQAARSEANYFYTKLYHPATGMVYKTNSQHPNGYYRVDLAMEIGCALIQAGKVFNQPQWADAGQRIVNSVYSNAYLPQYHALLFQMDNVLLPNGSPNPTQTIFRDKYGKTNIEGGQVRMGAVSQVILSMLHVYIVTGDKSFLDKANDLLVPLTAEDNSLGLWDTQHLGYFSALIFPGPTAKDPGTPKLSKGMKESGRQLQMLEAYRVANSLENNRYQSMQNVLQQLGTGQAFYKPGHGVLYEMTNDWQVVTLKNGQQVNWVTTEAMGIALQSLFSLQEAHPW